MGPDLLLDGRVGFVNKGFDRHLSDENGGIPSGPVHIDGKGLETKDAEALWFAVTATVFSVCSPSCILKNVFPQGRVVKILI